MMGGWVKHRLINQWRSTVTSIGYGSSRKYRLWGLNSFNWTVLETLSKTFVNVVETCLRSSHVFFYQSVPPIVNILSEYENHSIVLF